MALVVKLNSVEYLKGRYDRVVRITFRGKTLESNVIRNAKRVAYFGQAFEWPIARPIESQESLEVLVFNYSRYLSHKFVGSLILILQHLVQEGQLSINENLVDKNNQATKVTISFEAHYVSPDGKLGNWAHRMSMQAEGTLGIEEEDEEDELLREERNLIAQAKVLEEERDDEQDDMYKDDDEDFRYEDEDDAASLKLVMENANLDRKTHPAFLNLQFDRPKEFEVMITIIEGQQLTGLDLDPVVKIDIGDQSKYTSIRQSTSSPFYNEYFVFNFNEMPAVFFDKILTITAFHSYNLPGRHLFKAGNIVAAKRLIGSFRCDLGMVYMSQDHQYYHKWAVLTDPDDLETGPKGYIKCDIAITTRGQPLTVPKSAHEDTDNIEGNLLLPVGVSQTRHKAVYTLNIFKAEDLPQTSLGLLASMQRVLTKKEIAFIDACVRISFVGQIGKTSVIKSYFPEWNESLRFVDMFPPLCNRIKVQLLSEELVTDDAVATHFIELPQIMDPGEGVEGILPTFGPSWINMYGTKRAYKMKKDGTEELNEGLGEGTTFRGRLLVSLKTSVDPTEMADDKKNQVIKQKITERYGNQPKKPFLLFGSLFEASMIDSKLEGKPIHFEMSIGQFGIAFDEKTSAKAPIPGLALDNEETDEDEEEEMRDGGSTKYAGVPDLNKNLLRAEKIKESNLPFYSATPRKVVKLSDKSYGHMPLDEEKPCLFVVGMFEDNRKRHFHSNILYKMAEILEKGLNDVKERIKKQDTDAHRRMRGLMEKLRKDCEIYLRISFQAGPGSGKTRLDEYRLKSCRRFIEKLKETAIRIKKLVTLSNMKKLFREIRETPYKLKTMAKDPQDCLPDVIIWMICDKERIAYHRIPAREILDSQDFNLRGKNSSKRQIIFLKKPGKKSHGQSGWVIQAKLDMYLWLGDFDLQAPQHLEGLPSGFDPIFPPKTTNLPPIGLNYRGSRRFQLRAYLFQARSLIPSDDTGLSDPFAKVVIGNQVATSQIIKESLSPTWDETLVCDNIVLLGNEQQIKEQMENESICVVVEVFDYDALSTPEFLGRATVIPQIRLIDELNGEKITKKTIEDDESINLEKKNVTKATTSEAQQLVPEASATEQGPLKTTSGFMEERPISQLEWWDVYRGTQKAGQLLASFELIEDTGTSLPPLPDLKCDLRGKVMMTKQNSPLFTIPPFIKPLMTRYRIEILFRGVRDLKRIQMMSVDHPHVIVECAGQVKTSSKIVNMDKNNNFDNYLQSMDIDLPTEEDFWPPLTIRCLEARTFGRTLLVGIHTIDNIYHYLYQENFYNHHKELEKFELEEQERKKLEEEEEKKLDSKSLESKRTTKTLKSFKSSKTQSGKIENLKGETSKGVTFGPKLPANDEDNTSLLEGQSDGTKLLAKDVKSKIGKKEMTPEEEAKKRARYKELINELDWWSKYFISKQNSVFEHKAYIEKMKAKLDHDLIDEYFGLSMLDYSGFDQEAFNKEVEEAKKRALEAEKRKEKKKKKKKKKTKKKKKKRKKKLKKKMKKLKGKINEAFKPEEEMEAEMEAEDDDLTFDLSSHHIQKMKIYMTGLEEVPEFKKLTRFFQTFQLFRGKRSEEDEENDQERFSGNFKGQFAVYKLTEEEAWKSKLEEDNKNKSVTMATKLQEPQIPPQSQNRIEDYSNFKLFKYLPTNKTVEVKIFVYIVKALDLHPTDFDGRADPYLVVKCGRDENIDKENRIMNQLNPVFGRTFEYDAVFPLDSILRIQIWDYDSVGRDDLIGETSIDLEDRYFTHHMGCCGLQNKYEIYGYNVWRNPLKPTELLTKFCNQFDLPQPIYTSQSVSIGNDIQFVTEGNEEKYVENENGELRPTNEHLALKVLKNWHLVPNGWPLIPEHIETRSLYNKERPGIEQGRLEMWVDMFPRESPKMPTIIDITPRKPKSYELRVIIWNTDEVSLDDVNMLTGEASSDIFVKGFVKGVGVDDLKTDVHYRSLTGEGNFNWRFLFKFDYLKAENKIVFNKKEHVFATDEVEHKVPPFLNVQVWDADLVTADDFLGSVLLNLLKMPKPVKKVEKCSLRMIEPGTRHPTINLFKNKRCKGWWPVAAREKPEKDDDDDDDDDEEEEERLQLKGKVEMEIELLTEEEAEKNPVGVAREEPEALPKPNRPDTSFLWFMNPLKTLKYIIWKNYKWLIIKLLILIIIIFFIVLFVYNFPGAIVNRILNI